MELEPDLDSAVLAVDEEPDEPAELDESGAVDAPAEFEEELEEELEEEPAAAESALSATILLRAASLEVVDPVCASP